MAEGNGLLNRRTGLNSYPGFESRPLRCAAYFGVGGIRSPKGCGEKISPRRRGDRSVATPEGQSPYGNSHCEFGFQSRPLRFGFCKLSINIILQKRLRSSSTIYPPEIALPELCLGVAGRVGWKIGTILARGKHNGIISRQQPKSFPKCLI